MITISFMVMGYIYVLLHLNFDLIVVHYIDHYFAILNLAQWRGHIYTYMSIQMLLHLVAY